MAPSRASALRVFLGIFTRVAQYEHRALMRATMLALVPSPQLGVVESRFVVCGTNAWASTADERRDVLVLNVSNSVPGRGMCGKHRGSLELLAAIDALWPGAFDWIAKTDVDAFVVLPNLLRALAPLPRSDGYFGIHCLSGHFANKVQLYRTHSLGDRAAHRQFFWDDREHEWPFWFMCGMLYAVTPDIAHWLATEAKPPRTNFGMTGEDFLLRTWLHEGKRGANAHTCLWEHCYDLPMPTSASQNALPMDATVRRHHVKSQPEPLLNSQLALGTGGAGNVTLGVEKAAFQTNRALNREPPDAAEDEAAGHAGHSARVAAWLAFGNRMVLETVVVHNIKTFGEFLSVASYFERHRQRLVHPRSGGGGKVGPGASEIKGGGGNARRGGGGGGRNKGAGGAAGVEAAAGGAAGQSSRRRETPAAAEAAAQVAVDREAPIWTLPLRPRAEWQEAQAAYCRFLGLPAPTGDWRARPGCGTHIASSHATRATAGAKTHKRPRE